MPNICTQKWQTKAGYLGQKQLNLISFLMAFLLSPIAFSGGELSGGSAPVFQAALKSRNLTTSYQRYRVPTTDIKVKPFTQLCFDSAEDAVRIIKPGFEDDLFPVHYEKFECVEWIAGDSHSGRSKIKFTDEKEAKRYIRFMERPYKICSKKEWVPKQIPLYFQVDFYGKKVYRLEGSYQYRIPSCGEQMAEQVLDSIKPIKALDTEII